MWHNHVTNVSKKTMCTTSIACLRVLPRAPAEVRELVTRCSRSHSAFAHGLWQRGPACCTWITISDHSDCSQVTQLSLLYSTVSSPPFCSFSGLQISNSISYFSIRVFCVTSSFIKPTGYGSTSFISPRCLLSLSLCLCFAECVRSLIEAEKPTLPADISARCCVGGITEGRGGVGCIHRTGRAQ